MTSMHPPSSPLSTARSKQIFFVVKAKASQSSSKSLTSKGVPTRNLKRDTVSSISKLSITPSMVLDKIYKRKDPPILLRTTINKDMSIKRFCKDEAPILSPGRLLDGTR
ncbi:hypothetical protein HAX54_042985 [Datura stramonium]|uniref:Uncharacterized protein n=1 Tax=Datura stramonium TaxID=4076 RepID=A0ABS8W2N6_DATST|nr:hypothetical protein [Datura stramonium]